MKVSQKIYDFIKEAGIKAYPKEACGLLYAKGKKAIPVECRNDALEPEHNFLINGDDYVATMNLGEIVGCWHTHCNTNAKPSDADRQGCENTEVTWFIGAVNKDEKGEFTFEGIETITPEGFMMPLIGRPYVYGTFDCYTLLRDYYKTEMGIDLGDFLRGENPWDAAENFFLTKGEEMGFVPTGGTPEKGDVFLLQCGKKIDHICIYIGDDMILHHMRDRLSRRDIYGGSYWQERTIYHMRYNKDAH
jgi:proteasome lid subunit RPN8/RPN11